MTGKKRPTRVILISLLVTVSLFLSASGVLAADAGYVYYKVQAGDYLWSIAWKFETTVDAIKAANHLASDMIYQGQNLQIPKSTGFVRALPTSAAYSVKQGDTLYLMSQRFGIGVTSVMTANKLAGTTIYVGQNLVLPLPAQQRYIVQNGDTLALIGQRFGAAIELLKLVNKMNSTSLWIGQVLFVPDKAQTVTPPPTPTPVPAPAPVPAADPTQESTPSPTPVVAPVIPVGGQWGPIPDGVTLYHVLSGENLWVLAKRFNTTEDAIKATNHLHTDLIQVNQPLFIPRNSTEAKVIPYPMATKKGGFGELLNWEYVSWILDTHNIATIQDLETGKSFKVRRLGGSNHADMEPFTAADTAIMKEIYGGQWSWERRAVLVQVDGQVIAGSMAGMPHSIETITDNNFAGHFDLHFLNSRTHYDNSVDPEHQAMVRRAAGE